ncbi:hypothetical protein [Leptobacterium sp. I13]|uniref:hypothetical protein n=1 Tax=Leptobacterium meishanense TaxID=3128904 RepID=UPI0030ED8385
MALLKRIKAATLMETMFATVLIVIIFMIASLTLNNLFSNTINHNTEAVESYMNKLEYQYQHTKMKLPYTETYNSWNISINKTVTETVNWVEITAVNLNTHKKVTRKLVDDIH